MGPVWRRMHGCGVWNDFCEFQRFRSSNYLHRSCKRSGAGDGDAYRDFCRGSVEKCGSNDHRRTSHQRTHQHSTDARARRNDGDRFAGVYGDGDE